MDRSDEKSGRNAIIYQEKKAGVSPTELGKKYGLSGPRIHRICLKEENKDLKQQVLELQAEIALLKKERK